MADELYGSKQIRENKLERIENHNQSRDYLVSFEIPEFTCLCPRSGFPDFACITIEYQPGPFIVELKSLKLYINAFRDQNLYHEDVPNRLLDDLVELLSPKYMHIRADFNVRGNIHTVVSASHGKKTDP